MSIKDTLYNMTAKPSDIPEILKMAKLVNRPLIILGQFGIGKSRMVEQFADEHFNGNLKTIILARHEPGDFALPCPVRQADGSMETVYAKTNLLPQDPDWKGVLFLDEFTQADSGIQKIAQQLLLDRSFMDYTLPAGCMVVLAGNRSFDNAGSGDLLSTVANRCIVVELQGDTTEWLEWASKSHIHPSLLHFFHEHERELFDDLNPEGCPSITTPRSAEFASDILWKLEAGEIPEKIAMLGIQGVLGNNKWNKIKISFDLAVKLPKAQDILEGKDPIFDKTVGLSGIFAVLSSCNYHLGKMMREDQEKALDYGVNLINYIADHISGEYELVCSNVNKMLQLGKDNLFPQFVGQLSQKKPRGLVKLLQEHSQFAGQMSKMLG
jgi:hypothetical protein